MNALLLTIARDVLLPEITDIIRRRLEGGGTLPTDDEIRAELEARAARIKQRSNDYIAQIQAALAAAPPTGSATS